MDAGSSPRVRGTQGALSDRIFEWRIIPARAGNTCTLNALTDISADHPRACGEHPYSPSSKPSIRGSSPRVRGTRSVLVGGAPVVRIIPARAGNTERPSLASLRPTDHPRACGEHQVTQPAYGATSGSSPRVRGTPHRAPRLLARVRIIPARAGNTFHYRSRGLPLLDHPRACGEHSA